MAPTSEDLSETVNQLLLGQAMCYIGDPPLHNLKSIPFAASKSVPSGGPFRRQQFHSSYTNMTANADHDGSAGPSIAPV